MALEKPQLRERSKRGNEVAGRLCHALEEVQQERIDILLEAQRIGVQGLVLDFCRQNDDTGMDWHAHGRGRYGLRAEVAGDAAL